ncbi:MAG: hypothetical protein AAF327_09805 [Cyanobacteria bacterium P01_A01_bin.37]
MSEATLSWGLLSGVASPLLHCFNGNSLHFAEKRDLGEGKGRSPFSYTIASSQSRICPTCFSSIPTISAAPPKINDLYE